MRNKLIRDDTARHITTPPRQQTTNLANTRVKRHRLRMCIHDYERNVSIKADTANFTNVDVMILCNIDLSGTVHADSTSQTTDTDTPADADSHMDNN